MNKNEPVDLVIPGDPPTLLRDAEIVSRGFSADTELRLDRIIPVTITFEK